MCRRAGTIGSARTVLGGENQCKTDATSGCQAGCAPVCAVLTCWVGCGRVGTAKPVFACSGFFVEGVEAVLLVHSDQRFCCVRAHHPTITGLGKIFQAGKGLQPHFLDGPSTCKAPRGPWPPLPTHPTPIQAMVGWQPLVLPTASSYPLTQHPAMQPPLAGPPRPGETGHNLCHPIPTPNRAVRALAVKQQHGR
jgi:hypothetical protein